MKVSLSRRLLLCLALLFSECLIADDGNLEYKVKAAYLYNFTKFVTWPEIKSETFNVCLLGDDPFGHVIGLIEKKTAFTLPIKVIRLPEFNSNLTAGCHILYLNAVNNAKTVFDKINGAQQKLKALVVGEGEDFASDGGMIGFVNRDGKIRLQINPQSIKLAGLMVSAKLLEISEIIKETNHD